MAAVGLDVLEKDHPVLDNLLLQAHTISKPVPAKAALMDSTNNVERFRKRFEDNKICVGRSVQLRDPLVSGLATEAGNDLIWIEMEHSHMGLVDAMGLIIRPPQTTRAT